MEAETNGTAETKGAKAKPRRGCFKPGQSGNRGGRPKLTTRALEVRAACREASARAIERLAELLEADDPAVVLKAADAILTRAWGTPGTEEEVRHVDMTRAIAADERKNGRGGILASLDRQDEPPPDVD